MTFNEIQGKE